MVSLIVGMFYGFFFIVVIIVVFVFSFLVTFFFFLKIFWHFSLQRAISALSQLEQPSSQEVAKKSEAAKKIEAAIKLLKKRIVNGLLQHRDKDVRLLVAICVSEIFRILAPEPPFEDKYLRVKLYHIRMLWLIFSRVLAHLSLPLKEKKIRRLNICLYSICVVILSPSISHAWLYIWHMLVFLLTTVRYTILHFRIFLNLFWACLPS